MQSVDNAPLEASSTAPVPAGRADVAGLESRVVWIAGLILAAAGILLRLQRYFVGRSFRGDEAGMALAIESHSFVSMILRPLGGHLTAPPGFLAVEKLAVGLLGTHDYVFRLFPLLTGLLSVVLMYLLARRVLSGVATLFCIGAFSLNWVAAFYASDLKQYSGDILVALAVYIAAARYFDSQTRHNAAILAAVGVIAISFSHPAIFLLAAVGPVLLLSVRRQPGALRHVIVIGALWIAAFLALYLLFYRVVGQQTYVVDYWNDLNGLMPMPPWKDWSWFGIRTGSFFITVMILSRAVVLDVLLFALGLFSFVRGGRWHWAAWLLGPVLFTFLASAVANYPFKGRLIVFLIPGTLLAMSEGVQWLASLLRPVPVLQRTSSWLLVLFLLWAPGQALLGWMGQPRSTPYPEDIRPALAFVHANKQPSDMIVVYSQANPTYRYYAPFFGLSNNPTTYLQDYRKTPEKYKGIIDVLPRNTRIWFVFSAVVEAKGNIDERTYILNCVHSVGGKVIQETSVSGGISSAELVIIKEGSVQP